MNYRIFFFIILLLPFAAIAQQEKEKEDTLVSDTLNAYYKTLSPDMWLRGDSIPIVIELESFTGFDPLQNITWWQNTGVLGSPYEILWFPDYAKQLRTDFFAFMHRPDQYMFTRENIPLFTDSVPFSIASYSNGYKREQYFDFIHSQRLAKQWRLTLDYRLINSPGAYKNQKLQQSHFFTTIEYKAKSDKYHMTAGLVLNKVLQQENGGLLYANNFIDTTVYDRQLASVQLLTAQNRMRQNDFFLVNEFRFGSKNNRKRIFAEHTFNYRSEYHVYSDSDPLNGYYQQILLDSTITTDSVAHRAFENKIIIGNKDSKTFRWYASAFYSSDQLYNLERDSSLSQKIISAGFALQITKQFTLVAKMSSDATFNSDGDRNLSFELLASDSLKWKPSGLFCYNFIKPGIFYSQYSGNHIAWQHNWAQTQTVLAMASLGYKRSSISIFYANINHQLYFDGAEFLQGGQGNISGILGKTDFDFGRFHLNATAGYQHVKSAPYLHLPDWFAKCRLTMHNSVFKKALSLQTGLGLWINDSYYADAYNPVIQTFVVQNSIKTGGFIYPTLFVRAQIKRAIVFLEMINFTAGFTKINYWQTPGYPLPDRGFRFGVTWSFLN
ncbi:MAG: hypothetical protein CVU11_11665 [Bacteroidetes bacterium HGW-Bacteroidetes-6]|jgi:hypothetical protein|nr:MAG: hypothetical protein CVU11_11665 [Bacteroidetes bacterium HGW-Bacteroidetes-6]